MTAVFTTVQQGPACTGTGSVALTIPSPVTAGNHLIAGVCSTTAGAFTPPNGNWRQAETVPYGGSAGGHIEVWYLEGKNEPGGETQYVFTGPTGVNLRGCIQEINSTAGTGFVLDAVGSHTGTSATTMNIKSTVGCAADDYGFIFIGNSFSSAPSGTWTTPSGWTAGGQYATVQNTMFSAINADLTAGNQAATGGYSTSTNETGFAWTICCFRAQRFAAQSQVGGANTNSMALHPTSQAMILCGDVEGAWRSVDQNLGDHWQGVQANLFQSEEDNTACAYWSLTEANTVYMGLGKTGSGGFAASTDGGMTWTLRATGPQYRANDSTSPPSTSTKLDRSVGNHQIVQDATNGYTYTCAYNGFKRSANNGTTWTDISPVSGCIPRCVAQNPSNPKELWVGVWAGTPSSSTGGVYHTSDATQTTPTWTQLTGYTGTVADMVIVGNFIYIAANVNGIFQYQYTGSGGANVGINMGATTLAAYYAPNGTIVDAATTFDERVGKSMAVTRQKWYFQEGSWPSTVPATYTSLKTKGVGWTLCVKPLRSAVTAGGSTLAAEITNLTNALNAWKPQDVILWQECNQAHGDPGSNVGWFTESGATGEPSYQQYWDAYAPTIKTLGYKCCFDPLTGTNITDTNFGAAMFPSGGAGGHPDIVYCDWYGNSNKNSITPYTLATSGPASGSSIYGLADAKTIPCGIGEWANSADGNNIDNPPNSGGGNNPQPPYTNWNAYVNEMVSIFTTRASSNLPCADVMYYSGGVPTGGGYGPNDIPPNSVTGDPAVSDDYQVAGANPTSPVTQGIQYVYRELTNLTFPGTSGSKNITSLNGNGKLVGGIATGAGIFWNTIDGFVDANGNNQVLCGVGGNAGQPTGAPNYQNLVNIQITSGGTGTVTFNDLTSNATMNFATIPPDNYGWWKWPNGSPGNYQNWLGGGSFNLCSVLSDPNNRSAIYVAGAGGFYRSYDFGQTWQAAVNGANMLNHYVSAIDPNNPNHVIIGGDDYGHTDIYGDLTAQTIGSVTVNSPEGPNNGESHAVCFRRSDSFVGAGFNTKYGKNTGGAVHIRPGNQPTNWSAELGYATAASNAACEGLALGTDNNGVNFIIACSEGKGLFRATQISTAWQNASSWSWSQPSTGAVIGTSGNVGQIIPIIMGLNSDQNIYVFDRGSGLYHSGDYGQTWTFVWAKTTSTQTAGWMAMNPNTSGELWISTDDTPNGLYKLSNVGGGTVSGGQVTVTAITTGPSANPGGIAFWNGAVYVVWDNASGHTSTQLMTTSNLSSASPTWTDASPQGEIAQYVQDPHGLHVNSNGFMLLDTDYNGATIGYLGAPASTPLAINTSGTLTAGVVNQAYSYTLSAQGGVPPYTWVLNSGSLPTGLQLGDVTSGVIDGTPTTTTGSPFTFTVKVIDSATPTANTVISGTLTINVSAAPVVSINNSTPLPNAPLNVSYSDTLTATGGTAPYTWTIQAGSGSLPTGLSLSSGGVISGTPTVPGGYTFTAVATDSASHVGTKQLSITVQQSTLQVTTVSLPAGVEGVPYTFTLTASGGTSPYTWSVDSAGVTLPTGLSLSTSGVISGTPTQVGDGGNVIFDVSDSVGSSTSAGFDFLILDPNTVLGGGVGARKFTAAIGTLVSGGQAVQSIGYEVFVFDFADGYRTLLAQIPRWNDLKFSKMINDKGSGQIILNLDDDEFWDNNLPNAQTAEYLLDYENLWQVRKDGIPVFEFLGETVQEQLVDPSEQRMATVTGPGTIQTLTWARAMPPGFPEVIFKTDALSDSFDEVDSNGNPELDTAKWNLSTPLSQISLVPAGAIGSTAAGTNPNAPQFYLGTCYLQPNNSTVYLGAGTYDITSSVLSAQVLPIAGPGLDASQVSAMYVQNVNDSNQFAQMQVTVEGLSASVGHGSGNITSKNFGPYSATSHAFWQITEESNIFYFWTSADGQSWARKWSVPHVWTPHQVDVFFAASYDAGGQQMGVSSINQDVITPTVSGNLYYNEPIMAIWLDQLGAAKDRGTIPFVTTRMTSQGDSFGNMWTDKQSVQVTNGTDLYSLLQGNCAMVNADFLMEPGFVLKVGLPSSKPGQDGLGIGADLSAGPGMVLLRESRKQLTKQRTRARDSIANLIGSINSDNTIVTATDENSIDTWLQREGWVQTGATVTESANQTAAEASVFQTGDEVLSWTLTIPPEAPGATAFKDFQVGDWVSLDTPGIPTTGGVTTVQNQPVRVVAIGVEVDQDGLETVELTVNSYRQWLQEQLSYLASKFGGDFVSTNGTQQITNQVNNPVGLPSVVSPLLGGLGDVIVSP